MDKATYAELCALLAEHTGAKIKPRTASARTINKYAHERGFPSLKAYLTHAKANIAEELSNLCDYGLIHVTSFSRDRKLWEVLHNNFFQKIEPGEPIRILSLGCSSGPELATAAVLAHQRTEAKNIQIDAYDISQQCVKEATDPVFAKRLTCKLPISHAAILKSVQDAGKSHFRLIPELSANIRARAADVRIMTGDWWGQEAGAYDLVLCRNILVYLGETVAQEIYPAIWNTGNKQKHGFLGIGCRDAIPPKKLFSGLHPMVYRMNRVDA